MPVKTILLGLSSPGSTETLLRAAVPLARRFGAHLIGMHIHESLVVYPGIAVHVPDEVFTNFHKSQNALSEEIKAIFERHTRLEDFASEWRLVKSDRIPAADRMVECAHVADLILVTQSISDTYNQSHDDVVEKLIRESGRPVVVIPDGYKDEIIGDTILLGWNATTQAARVAHDLLDIAMPGAQIGLLTVGKSITDDLHDSSANDLAESFDRHGLKAKVIHRDLKGTKVVKAIVKEARAIGADLIATGAFGHSRGYDLLFGAATRDLLKKSPFPVLFSH